MLLPRARHTQDSAIHDDAPGPARCDRAAGVYGFTALQAYWTLRARQACKPNQ